MSFSYSVMVFFSTVLLLVYFQLLYLQFFSSTLYLTFIVGAQYAWLVKDLEKVDRKVTPWLVATWHPPWYNSYASHYQEFECMRQELEALLYQYGVDIVFSGHVSWHISFS